MLAHWMFIALQNRHINASEELVHAIITPFSLLLQFLTLLVALSSAYKNKKPNTTNKTTTQHFSFLETLMQSRQ